MKTRTKIAITVLAATLYFALAQIVRPNTDEGYVRDWYAIYNVQYFDDKLPKDTVVTYADIKPTISDPRTDLMGITWQDFNQKMHIQLNPRYVSGERFAKITLLHEMCHIKTWGQSNKEHSFQWRACMLGLDTQGAFRKLIVDGYTGD